MKANSGNQGRDVWGRIYWDNVLYQRGNGIALNTAQGHFVVTTPGLYIMHVELVVYNLYPGSEVQIRIKRESEDWLIGQGGSSSRLVTITCPIMLNDPSEFPIRDLSAQWAHYQTDPLFFNGGDESATRASLMYVG
jgi:hypothetical protein